MVRVLAQVREDERHSTFWAVVTVFLVLVAHSILETARDTLFLSHLPATNLPWVYLGLAGLALLSTRAFAHSAGPRGDLRQLILIQLAAAAGTACFLVVTRSKPPWALYALYIWGGLASTLILIRFWLLLANRYTASQAKRLFPIVAAGPLLGSLVGYGVAGLLSRRLPPGDLLGVSAAIFLLSACGSFVLWRAQKEGEAQDSNEIEAQDPARERRTESAEATLRESIAVAIHHPYVGRVTLLLLMASVTVTIGDFIFKSVVAKAIEPQHLGSFLATAYFGFDLLALALLFTAVVPFVRSRGVTESLALQPLLLIGSGALLTVVGGLGSVLCLRGVDGALRWTLHKTATELLYVPLSSRLRRVVKGVTDILAHRGGQALGSLLILTWLAVSPSERWMGPVVIACAAAWIYFALTLRQPYLDLFRETLSERSIETRLEFPDLDMDSLETLMTALSSPDDNRVLAAMYLLEETGRAPLVPTLILYHPSPAVVVRALDLFTTTGRDDFLPLSEHLLRHPDESVRAAIMRSSAMLRGDVEALRRASESESPGVASTALVALAALGGIDPSVAQERLEPFLAADAENAGEVRFFIARALRDHPSPQFAPLLARLAAAPEVPTRLEAIRAMGAARDAQHLPVLVGLVVSREVRETAREALLAYGPTAFEYLTQALHDLALPRAVRLHLPRTISRFGDQAAADVLLRQLLVEPSGSVRFKILRGLGRLVSGSPLELDADVVDEVVVRHLTGCFQLLHWRVELERGAKEDPHRKTIGHELLADLLQQKESLARERLFRGLGLKYPSEDLAQIYDGLDGDDPATRSSSRELLHTMLPANLRGALVGLVDELPDEARLTAGSAVYTAEELSYEALLARLVEDSSVSLCCIASYHVGELGFIDLRGPIEAREVDSNEGLAWLRQKSFDLLGRSAEPAKELRRAT